MSTFGRYTLLRRIGRGGMAEIWKAKASGPSGFVKYLALKTILPDIADDRTFVSMFVDEAKLEASLVHPNLISVFDFGEWEGRYFLAMEYVAGGNVSRLLTRLGQQGRVLPSHVALYIAREACRGLSYAHGKADASGTPLGIVHRDVSPQNILVSATGDVKVGDFGIAKSASVLPRTGEGRVRGKIAYMSPEQLSGWALDGRSDLFSLGVVLYEMLTCRRLFSGATTNEVADQISRFDPMVDLDTHGLPPAILNVLIGVLQRDPSARYRDADRFENELGNRLGLSMIGRAKKELSALVRTLCADELAADAADETGEVELGTPSATSGSPRPDGGDEGERPTSHHGLSALVTAPTRAPTEPARASTDPTRPTTELARPPTEAARSAAEVGISGPRARPTWRLWALVLVVAAATGTVAALKLGLSSAGGPRHGETLRIAMALPVEEFDLFSIEASRTRVVLTRVIQPLFETDRDSQIVPGVIGRSELTEGGRTVTLHLRPDLWFHEHPCLPDGRERLATGADVAFSIVEAIRAGVLVLPIHGAEAIKAGGSTAVGIQVIGETVVLSLDAPAPFYEAQLAVVRLVPRDLRGCEDLHRMRQPVGTGAFRFTGPQRSAVMRLVRAPRYWRRSEDGDLLPFVDSIEIVPIDDVADVLSRLGRGELDIVMPARSDWEKLFDLDADRVQLNRQYRPLGLETALYSSKNRIALFGLIVGAADGPLRDRRVRHAVAEAIDRGELAPSASGMVPNGRLLDSRMLGYDPSIRELGYSPERARSALAEANDPRVIRIGTINYRELGEALVAQLARVGLHAELVTIPPAKALETLRSGQVDAFLGVTISVLRNGEHAEILADLDRYIDSQPLRPLRTELTSTIERADRAPIYRRIELEMLAELPIIPLGWGSPRATQDIFILGKTVRGFHDPVTGYGRIDDLDRTWIQR